ncbi:hypothetical protein AMJ44_06180 [candidate division WOR-1 bacterium DG_54_3]|uniref:Uncharacterized protein n=1 Tax=candidate division WOR-1 bacterium DG_54_3 TaxID=1703775 RepID=A0A0S7Y1F4_UNCSA|nr:MAG: hypothetical protein AMJ44_06180 [candidate division WOR-1 bacterium DG_54_3]
MNEKSNPDKIGTDKISLLLMIMIILVLGAILLYQYQRPLVTAVLYRIFGEPPITKAVELPSLPPPVVPGLEPAAVPAAPTPEVVEVPVKPTPEALVRLPREYEGLKFSSSYKYIKPLILKKYKPVPKQRTRAGENWRIISDGTKVYQKRREIILEYMGTKIKNPRYLSFKFYDYVLTGVIEKYYGVDPGEQLKKVIDKYGQFRTHDRWKGKERYIWDDGQMQIIFLADSWAKTALFSFQIKMFASELR